MKYKKGIVTGAIALSLIMGSGVYAATPQDLGIKKVNPTFPKQKAKDLENKKGSNTKVGVVSNVSGTGFTIEVKNLKDKTTSSVDIKTDSSTKYVKDGAKSAGASDLVTGQKVVVTGTLDKTTNVFTAKKVRIVAVKTTLKEKKPVAGTTVKTN